MRGALAGMQLIPLAAGKDRRKITDLASPRGAKDARRLPHQANGRQRAVLGDNADPAHSRTEATHTAAMCRAGYGVVECGGQLGQPCPWGKSGEASRAKADVAPDPLRRPTLRGRDKTLPGSEKEWGA